MSSENKMDFQAAVALLRQAMDAYLIAHFDPIGVSRERLQHDLMEAGTWPSHVLNSVGQPELKTPKEATSGPNPLLGIAESSKVFDTAFQQARHDGIIVLNEANGRYTSGTTQPEPPLRRRGGRPIAAERQHPVMRQLDNRGDGRMRFPNVRMTEREMERAAAARAKSHPPVQRTAPRPPTAADLDAAEARARYDILHRLEEAATRSGRPGDGVLHSQLVDNLRFQRGMMQGALADLEQEGLIEPKRAGKGTTYVLTDPGRTALRSVPSGVQALPRDGQSSDVAASPGIADSSASLGGMAKPGDPGYSPLASRVGGRNDAGGGKETS